MTCPKCNSPNAECIIGNYYNCKVCDAASTNPPVPDTSYPELYIAGGKYYLGHTPLLGVEINGLAMLLKGDRRLFEDLYPRDSTIRVGDKRLMVYHAQLCDDYVTLHVMLPYPPSTADIRVVK